MKSRIEDIIATIHSDYRPEVRYLKEITHRDTRNLSGIFEVQNSVHLLHPIEHVAISEIALCVNQFERVLVAQLVETGYVEEWGELDFTKWNPSKLGDEGLVIVHEEITFKGVVRPGIFAGDLWAGEERKSRNGNYHVNCQFDFAAGKHVGEVRICFIPEKAKLVNLEELR